MSGQHEAQTEKDEQAQAEDGDGAGRSETRAAPPVAGLGAKKPFRERPFNPEIVTVDPAEDDAEVYGAAWPLVEEWRRLRAGHPRQGKSMSWLVTAERLLVLELAMLEEHELTLPPEKQPLRGFGRRGSRAGAGRRFARPGWRCGSGSCCAGCGGSSPWDCGGSRRREGSGGPF